MSFCFFCFVNLHLSKPLWGKCFFRGMSNQPFKTYMHNSKSSFIKTPFFRLMKCVFCSYRYCKIHATYMDISIQSRHAEITGGSGSAPLPMYVVINNKYMLYFTISVRTVIMKSSQPKMTNHIADDFYHLTNSICC